MRVLIVLLFTVLMLLLKFMLCQPWFILIKVLLIVNVASRCGYTQSNYIALQNLYSKYQQQGTVVSAVCVYLSGIEKAHLFVEICES